uniref:ATP synthase complex subunit 8 n=1 Tax=Mantella madagascariensis TaxID=111290 RepID=Q2HXH7_9NEOB|nr:ATP synthase F0 subunit 8 [Mantella madagascariensis]BAE79518.1 ATPase subunit 8 [Mantella madagascariensis]
MPQLIPDPWFFTLLTSWLILMLLAPKKILTHITLNDPNSKNMKTTHSTWNWPW